MSSGEPSELSQPSLSPAAIPRLEDGTTVPLTELDPFNGIGIPVNEYLDLPETKALLAEFNNPSGHKSSSAPEQPLPPGEARSSHHVVKLLLLCQTNALVAKFDFAGDSQRGWGGVLRIGDCEVSSEGTTWQSKKAAKEGLSKLGLDALKSRTNVKDSPAKNWVAILHEFYARSIGNGLEGPVYMEYTLGSFFACTCTIPAHSTPFGSTSTSFSTKKKARNNAAMEAMQFLISEGLATPDVEDAAKTAKKPMDLDVVLALSSYAQRVDGLCPLLGIPKPQYLLAPNPLAPVANILSGAALFSPNPTLAGRVGEIRNVFGKKKAKEECAREVYTVLMKIAKEKIIFKSTARLDTDVCLTR